MLSKNYIINRLFRVICDSSKDMFIWNINIDICVSRKSKFENSMIQFL